jgi:hypothetical protein
MNLESDDLEKRLRHIILKRQAEWPWLEACKYIRRFSNFDTISIVHCFDEESNNGQRGKVMFVGRKYEETARKTIHEEEKRAAKIIHMAFRDIKGPDKPLPEVRLIDPLNMMLWFDALSSGEDETEVCSGEENN